MTSVPELSPPSSSSSSSDSDEYPFHLALSTDTFSPLLNPSSTFSKPIGIVMGADVSNEDILDTSSYTQHQLYPNLLKSLPPSPISYRQEPAHISWSPLSAGAPSSVPSDFQNQINACRSRRSETLPRPSEKSFYRPSHPSFVKFPESLPLNRPQLHGLRSPHPRLISNSMGTEALISLAWRGEISSPIAASGYAPSRIGDTYMWPKLRISDTQVAPNRRASWPVKCDERRVELGDKITPRSQQSPPGVSAQSNFKADRWTLANAISDDQVTDETLVELLEELRLRRLRSTERFAFGFSSDPITPAEDTPGCLDPGSPDGTNTSPRAPDSVPEDIAKAWSSARRAVLTCRELVLTERHYLASLHVLLKGETQSSPTPLMLSRLPALIDASTRLVDLMEANPSVMGVCAAFLQVYDQLEEAFIQWCEVVGQFFNGDALGMLDTLVRRSNSSPVGVGSVVGEKALLTKNVVGSWGRKLQSKTVNFEDIASMVTGNSKGKAPSKPSVRDLAILPTQRITRYVLLFKELLIRAPPLDIKPTIERAAEAAITLARKADRAQDHAAFRRASTT
ncbi:hypothetical protein NP233_g4272 [Leucocoprinus birnbaumii]|uniref:DH domain-containing protein n=1 Tax=Leucocoprinus birnbaumii TaxID=56174 RepID=A0AAD5VXQ2_9AGAR|nr:hypothetical protein NP233_g4272 [Leucocoprinus birnbaumii]